jgi:hypothetical protein
LEVGILSEARASALPKAVTGETDQNKSTDDDQTLQHEYWTAAAAIGFDNEAAKMTSGRTKPR